MDIVSVDVHVADREAHANVQPGRADRPPLRVDGALQSNSTFDRTVALSKTAMTPSPSPLMTVPSHLTTVLRSNSSKG